MKAIDALNQLLFRINKDTAREFVLSAGEPEQTLAQIQGRMQSLIRGNIERKPTGDFVERIRAAVHACRLSAKLDSRQMWLACKGCAMLLPPDDYMLMADNNALKYLLQLVEEECDQSLFFVKLYGRLLKAYFGHSNTPDRGESGRESLRKFLFERMEIVTALPRRPSG